MKCGISTNGIVWPAKITSCSSSQVSSLDSRPAQLSPSLESSTRYCSLRLLTWSIRAHRAPPTGALLSCSEGTGASMPGAGLEPARPEGQWIFSPSRLPVPPPRPGRYIVGGARRSSRRCESQSWMGWLFYSLTTVVLFALWSVLGKVALRTATPVQTTILYGVAAALVALLAIGLGERTASWSPGTLWVGAVSAVCGALGLLTFYLALDRGNASLAVPVIGFYPAVVAVLSGAFPDEKVHAFQGVGGALTGG